MTYPERQREILLVGSIPLASASDVFATCGRIFGGARPAITGWRDWRAVDMDRVSTARLAALPGFQPLLRSTAWLSPAFGLVSAPGRKRTGCFPKTEMEKRTMT